MRYSTRLFCLLHSPSDLLDPVALPRLHSTPKSWNCFRSPLPSPPLHLQGCFPGRSGWSMPGRQARRVCIRKEGLGVNKPSTSAEHTFSDSNQNFYFKSSQSTLGGPTCQKEDGTHGEGQHDKWWSTNAETLSLRASPLPIHN